ncbi:formyltetrahydrofolate deformylase [Paraburkholderia sp. CNPSo 3272]|uniref:formyltetrahydrofolate deformylase n=1 Tax=Paraburkholderia sp. CNPSo 3272 TaxID=2940931 RepID=UPI0020B7D967|nr:formyltetrahydrofolate deformylase [Paraburkholderia sp. CNPSo 3272]MCP3727099.1 formyltetrahydrofolate deformylase [Paraburkholderia sp. CNPSo 3272]
MTLTTKLPNTYVLRVTCPAAVGIVAAISGYLAAHGYYINEMSQYDDEETQRFFLRAVFQAQGEIADDDRDMLIGFENLAARFNMEWTVRRSDRPRNTVLMVSKFDHCLRDLLYRWEAGELNMEVVAIVSNHETLKHIAVRYNLPFIYLPVTPETKAKQEAALRALVAERKAELVVLARYMQILSDDIARDLHGNCINIHHSFLPSFKGGSPYAQAHKRGVKLIGATSHYVTGDLDEGPIIEQDIRRIDHRYSVAEMQAIGRDVECQVLARAVRMHLEERVFIDGNKTIVFS